MKDKAKSGQALYGTDFEVMLEEAMTEDRRKVLTFLYMPLIGQQAVQIYLTLFTLVKVGEYESEIVSHETLGKLLQMKQGTAFLEQRQKLEAIGLMETYYKDEFYIYLLKNVPTPAQFFQDDVLTELLMRTLGKVEYDKIACEFLLRRLNTTKFINISQSFDAVYELGDALEKENFAALCVDTTYTGIHIQKSPLDWNYFSILISALDIVDAAMLTDATFMTTMHRYSFLYQLSTEEMKDALVCACNIDKVIDYEALRYHVKRLYDQKGKKLTMKPQKVMVVSDNKVIRLLEETSPTVLVEGKYSTPLTSSEIAMFEQLLQDTGISLGILNVLIIYILDDKNGEIPSYNYFLKVINTWKRSQITSTQQAIDYINGRNSTTPRKTNSKPQKSVPEWYETYLNETEQKQQATSPVVSNDNLQDLLDFFKPESKK